MGSVHLLIAHFAQNQTVGSESDPDGPRARNPPPPSPPVVKQTPDPAPCPYCHPPPCAVLHSRKWQPRFGYPVSQFLHRLSRTCEWNQLCVLLIDSLPVDVGCLPEAHIGSADNQSWSVFRRDASPRKINWCPYKPLDIDRFHQYLLQSLNSRHVTNFGPGQKLLGDRFRSYLGNPDTHEVITAANGTAALHALVAGIGIARGMPLRTVTQAVTFAPAIQGPLKGSLVVDYDQALKGPCLDELGQHKDEFDAVLLTNCFGNVANMDVYVEWCRREQKVCPA